MAQYHEHRTVQWGHWGITFMDPNPDQTKNYGLIVGTVSFPVGVCGPADLGRREEYKAMCVAWIADRTIPSDLFPYKP